MIKVGITGATGCAGRNIVERLALDPSIKIDALGRNEAIGRELESRNCRFYSIDLTDHTQIHSKFKELDIVIHCAAATGPWGPYEHFYSTNVLGTQNVLSALENSSVRTFVYLSTPSIYFNNTSRCNIPESEALPKYQFTNYSKTKLDAENLVSESKIQNCKVFILRPRAIFGAYDRTILPRLTKVARLGFFPLIDGGSAKVDVTCVQNLSELVYQLCVNGSSRPGIYNVSNGEPITIKDLVRHVFSKLGLKPYYVRVPRRLAYHTAQNLEILFSLPFIKRFEPPLTKYTVGLIGHSQTLDISAARRHLGYKPMMSTQEGIDRYNG